MAVNIKANEMHKDFLSKLLLFIIFSVHKSELEGINYLEN